MVDPRVTPVSYGTLKGGAPLHPVTEAKRVRTRDGQQQILNGPFAEAKESDSPSTSPRPGS